MAHLDALPDHWDRRGRVYPLASRLAIHLLAAVGDGHSPEDAAEAEEEEPTVAEEAEELLAGCAVDGKSVRRSGDADRGLARTHIVSARLDNGLTVGQAAVPDQGNELTALRPLLPALALKGRVVTIDAMGCSTDVAEMIADEEGWYLLAVKDSEAHLHANLQRDFAYLDRHRRRGPQPLRDRGAGARTRRAAHLHDYGRPSRHPRGNRSRSPRDGPGLRRARGRRTHRARPHDPRRALLHHQPALDTGAARIANLVRGHWRVPSGRENSLHWVLDDTPGRTAAACAPAMPLVTWPPCGASP